MSKFRDVFLEIFAEEKEYASYFAKQPSFFQRDLSIEVLPGKALVLTGVRRSGKSTFLRQMMNRWLEQKSGSFRPLFVNFFDDRLNGIRAENLSELLDAHFLLYPETTKEESLYLFLDEIEVVEGWELFVERQIRTPGRQVFITGSSSRLLSTEIATAMRGRSLSYEVFPFSFQELVKWEGLTVSALRTDQMKLRGRLEKYLTEGGFPEVVHLNAVLQRKILHEYYEVLLLRDLIERHRTTSVELMRQFLNLMIQQVAAPMTINKTHERLKSMGLRSDKATISEFLKWVEDCFMLFPISLFSESHAKQSTNPKKIYCIDNGLAKTVSAGFSKNTGRLLENSVFLHFRSRGMKVNYFKDSAGREVDFVVNGGAELFQVCETLENPETRKREIDALQSAMRFFGVSLGKVITLGDPQEIVIPEGRIEVISAVKFLLSD